MVERNKNREPAHGKFPQLNRFRIVVATDLFGFLDIF